MDYYRHCFNFKDVQLNLLNTLADFGFVDKSTGDPLYDSFKPHDISSAKWKVLRWNHDLKADLNFWIGGNTVEQNFVSVQVCPSCDSYYNKQYHTRNIPQWHLNDDTAWSGTVYQWIRDYSIMNITLTGYPDTPISSSNNWCSQNTILIPLINGGFLYNSYLNFIDDDKIDPTPKLKIIGETLKGHSTTRTIIGIPNTLNTNLNNYLYFGFAATNNRDNGDPNTPTVSTLITDYQQSRVLDYIPYINTANTDYTDLNNNICTLIKMPYDNGYLDNVYMMATRPGELTKEGSFFSFAGRNFINVYKNLVLELPS